MGKFDGWLIATDLDGTLINRDGAIPQRNLDAIRTFQDEGGLFTIATGRSLAMCHSGRVLSDEADTRYPSHGRESPQACPQTAKSP